MNMKSDSIMEKPKKDRPIIAVKDVPSHGIAYPENTQISFTPYTVQELLTLSMSSMTKAQLLRFGLDGIFCNIDKHVLLTADVEYILLLRKLASYKTDAYTLDFTCAACEKQNTNFKNLKDLEFLEYGENVPEGTTIVNPPVVFKEDDLELVFTPETVADTLWVLENDVSDKLAMYARIVRNHTYENAYKILQNGTGDIIRCLGYLDDLFAFGLKDMLVTCKYCEVKHHIPMDDPEQFIYPFREMGDIIGNKVFTGV